MLRFSSENLTSDNTMVFRYLACLNSQTGKPLPLAKACLPYQHRQAQSREEQQQSGTRGKEGDTKDGYARAKKLLRLKLIELPTDNQEEA